MRGPSRARPEIARRWQQTGAEMKLPDAVRHDSGKHRIAAAGHPLGERFAAAGAPRVDGRIGNIAPAERGEKSRFHFFAAPLRIAPQAYIGARRLPAPVDYSPRDQGR